MSVSKKVPGPPSPQVSAVPLIVGTFVDVTWRMFVPVLMGTLAGWLIDKAAHTRPVFILGGLGLGVLGSCLLMVRLYKKVIRSMQSDQNSKEQQS